MNGLFGKAIAKSVLHTKNVLQIVESSKSIKGKNRISNEHKMVAGKHKCYKGQGLETSDRYIAEKKIIKVLYL